MFTNRRWGSVAAALAVVMAFARVYVGAHYPGDVVAGLALGAAIAAIGRLVAVPWLTRVAAWLSRTPVRPIVANAPPSTHPF
jgi:undecaprenyl-diphosphatase